MIALTTRGSPDWLRARRSQAVQARRQAEHHRRLADMWAERAAEFDAEIAQSAPPSQSPITVGGARG